MIRKYLDRQQIIDLQRKLTKIIIRTFNPEKFIFLGWNFRSYTTENADLTTNIIIPHMRDIHYDTIILQNIRVTETRTIELNEMWKCYSDLVNQAIQTLQTFVETEKFPFVYYSPVKIQGGISSLKPNKIQRPSVTIGFSPAWNLIDYNK